MSTNITSITQTTIVIPTTDLPTITIYMSHHFEKKEAMISLVLPIGNVPVMWINIWEFPISVKLTIDSGHINLIGNIKTSSVHIFPTTQKYLFFPLCEIYSLLQ